MDEPVFKVIDPVRRFLWWFVPSTAVFVAGLVTLLVSGHITGPFQKVTIVRALLASKREFFQDEQVKRILMGYGYQVHVTPIGSFDLANKEDLDSFHFVFPSGQTAAEQGRARRTGKHAISYRPFFSPIVLATYREYADALVKAEVATPQSETSPLYYDLDMDKLVKLVESKRLWNEYGLGNGNRIIAQSPDPCRTYSGSIYVALVAFAQAGNKTPSTEAEAVELARAIKPMFDVEGLHGEDMSPKYLAPEGPTFAPIAIIYEHQYMAHQVRRTENGGEPDRNRVLLYPKAQHQTAPELISFTQEGDRIGDLISGDPRLRQRAVELGLHILEASTPGHGIDFDSFLAGRGLPAPRTGFGHTETFLPSQPLFRKMLEEIGGCA